MQQASEIRPGIFLVPQECRSLCATDDFLFEAPAFEQRPALPPREDKGFWAGDMQSKQRTAQRSPIAHGSKIHPATFSHTQL